MNTTTRRVIAWALGVLLLILVVTSMLPVKTRQVCTGAIVVFVLLWIIALVLLHLDDKKYPQE